MRNIGMIISYEGTRYNGFQTQPNGNTVQDKLEEAIRRLTGEQVKVIASGRTDAGVHARRQTVNFHTFSRIPIGRWCLALNSLLPDDIVVHEAGEMPEHFHARRSAKRKTYCYTIDCGQFPNVFRRRTQFHHPASLDTRKMEEALTYLVGEHDFTSFCSTKESKESKVRTIYEAYIEYGDGYISIFITGNGFLYNMVRIIVGTLIEVGEGKKDSEDIPRILQAKDRSLAGPTAMAHGLTLWDVIYDMKISLDS